MRVAPALLDGAPGSTVVYYASARRLDRTRKLLLNTRPGIANTAVWLTNVAPGYAPAGQHLLSVAVLGVAQEDDDRLDRGIRSELSSWYGAGAAESLRRIAVVRVPFAQFRQDPGFSSALVEARTRLLNVVVASDAASSSSVQGALEAGERAAAVLLDDPAALLRPRGA
ncbi:MAG: hypothetical protein NVS4B3_27270 [Gemmatimonadaceae bacterium]